MNSLAPVFDAVVEGDAESTRLGVQSALEQGISASIILQDGLIAAMDEVGRRFEAGDFFVPEMLVSARAMQSGLQLLKPLLAESDVKSTGRVAIGTVKGDLHDIGKNLVVMMLEGAGYEVKDLGVDVPPEKFVQAVRDGAQILGFSALLTTTMSNMSVTLKALNEAGVRNQVKVMVGGAPVTQEFADKIGADAYAPDASSAVRVAHELVQA